MVDLNSEEVIKCLQEYDEKIQRIKSLLERLGYPKTYGMNLYAEWINDIMNYLKLVKSRSQIMECKDYLLLMKDGMSTYYHDLVREGMWMGIRPFHANIEEMIEGIDYSKADIELLSKVYGNIDYSIDYAENAFLLAAYMLGIKKEESIENIHMPMIRRLDSLPKESIDYFRY